MSSQPMTVDDVRRLALALPNATESPHHNRASFRVGAKIFATLPPDGASVNVMVDEETARAVAQEHPEAVELLWWGRTLSGVRIVLDRLPANGAALVREMLEEAWMRRAGIREHPR